MQPPFKLRNFKCCSVSSLIVIECSSDLQRLWSDCAYAQADLRLCWSHIPHCWKSHVVAQIMNAINKSNQLSFPLRDNVTNNCILTKSWLRCYTFFPDFFFCGSFVLFMSCVYHAFASVRCCLVVTGKGWPLGSCLWCLLWFCYFPIWYPGTGVVLDFIDSWSLLSFLLCMCASYLVNYSYRIGTKDLGQS